MFRITTSLVTLFLLTQVQSTYVSYDARYDNATLPLTDVSCSDGANGLITKYHYNTLGDVLSFPSVGGMQGITWNSPQCGSCWSLSYGGNTINVVAVDAANNGGFTLSLEALNALTNGNGVQFGHVDADDMQVDPSLCKMPPTN